VVRWSREGGRVARLEERPLDQAAGWLAARIGPGGAASFAIEPRSRATIALGPMHHGRAAVALAALAAHGGHRRALARGRAWLLREIEVSLAGRPVPGWPEEPAMVAGTLALAALGGLRVDRELRALAEQRPELAQNPWHAAQVAAALGPMAPRSLFRAAAGDLADRPWAPWTAMAARARGEARILERCERALIASIRTGPPHAGGASITPIPELAQTAVVVEALLPSSSSAAKAAVQRARAFLRRWQLLPGAIPASLDPALSAGAFPISPVVEALRCDVTGHALLALLGDGHARQI